MRLILAFILSIAIFPVAAQSKLLDSLYAELAKHPTADTTRLKIIFSICYKEYTSHPEKNKMLAGEALKIAEGINSFEGKKGTATANRYIALYYWTTGDFVQASAHAYKMLKISESISYQRGIGQALHLLGAIHEEEKDFEKAKDFYTRAIGIYQASGSLRDVGYGYNSLGSLHLNFLRLAEAEEYFTKSLEIRLKINDEDGLSQTYSNLAVVFRDQQKYEKALSYFEKALIVLVKLNNHYRIAVSYLNMGKLYVLTGDYSKAENYFFKAELLAKNISQKRILQETYTELSTLEKKRKRYETALKYFEQAAHYEDSIYTEEKTRQLAEIEAKYETEKKDQQITLLERDKAIQLLQRNIIIASLMSLMVVAVALYFLQLYKENKNREILNLRIDSLTEQHSELSLKYKNTLLGSKKKTMDSMDERLLKKAIEAVENNLSESSFNVEKMAYELGMSRTNMHRRIKAITGLPPSELIRSIRLRKAAVLLANKSDSISQISMLVGFEDHSYFSKAFKKQFGTSPSEYIQSNSENSPFLMN